MRAVTDHWRAQGQPDYISSVTEEPEESFALEGAPTGEDSAEDQQYRAAIALVDAEPDDAPSAPQRVNFGVYVYRDDDEASSR